MCVRADTTYLCSPVCLCGCYWGAFENGPSVYLWILIKYLFVCPTVRVCVFVGACLLEQFQVCGKIEQKIQIIRQPLPSHWSGTFVTVSEPVWTCHHHPGSRGDIKSSSWSCVFVRLGKRVMTRIPHRGVIYSIFTALRTLPAPPVHSSLPQPPGDH